MAYERSDLFRQSWDAHLSTWTHQIFAVMHAELNEGNCFCIKIGQLAAVSYLP